MNSYLLIVWLSSLFYNLCLGKIIHVFIAICTFQMIANISVCIFQCIPIASAYGISSEGSCIDINMFYLYNAILSFVTDIVVYSLPICTVAGLCPTTRVKVITSGIFALGFSLVSKSSQAIWYWYLIILVPAPLNNTPSDCQGDARLLWSHLGHRSPHVLVCHQYKPWDYSSISCYRKPHDPDSGFTI